MKLASVALAAIVASLATYVQAAPSFDCSKANTQVEKLICSSAELSALDNEVALSYQAALKDTLDAPGNEMLRITQQKWLKKRDLCADANCLSLLYQERKEELQSKTQSIGPSNTAVGKIPEHSPVAK